MKLGAVKLKKYLTDNNIRPSHFAREIGKFPSTIHRITDGQNCPDLMTASLIEEFTKGFVKREDWLQDVPVKRGKNTPITSGALNRK